MIRGVGVDIIDIPRVREVADRWGDTFLRRIFTAAELHHCLSKHDPHQHLAARFAAKEAVSKALATGWRGDFRWKDVEVINDSSGRPHVHLHGKLEERLANALVHITLSHSDLHVVALAIIEDGRP
jgi:holo-[acyl-carrier protein] synthase